MKIRSIQVSKRHPRCIIPVLTKFWRALRRLGPIEYEWWSRRITKTPFDMLFKSKWIAGIERKECDGDFVFRMKDHGIGRSSSTISFASLYGMSDYITFALGRLQTLMSIPLQSVAFLSCSQFWIPSVQILTVWSNRCFGTVFISSCPRESCDLRKSGQRSTSSLSSIERSNSRCPELNQSLYIRIIPDDFVTSVFT